MSASLVNPEAAVTTVSHRPVVLAWWLLMFGAGLRFNQARDPLATAQGNLNWENLMELSVAGFAIVVGYHLWRRSGNQRPTTCLGLLTPGLLVVVSAGWSFSPQLSLGKGTSVLAYGALSAGTLSFLSKEDRDKVFGSVSLLFVRTTAVLSCIGIVLGTRWSGRWTWPGTFPGTASILTAIALILVVVSRMNRSGSAIGGHELVIYSAPLLAMHLGAYTRGSTLSLVFALLVLGYKRLKANLGPSFALGILLLSSFALTMIVRFGLPKAETLLDRSHSGEDLSQLNGRRELWAEIVPRLIKDGRLLVGYGYSGSREPLLNVASWAGTAHAVPLQLLVDVGLIGCAVLTGLFCRMILKLWRSPTSLASLFMSAYLVYWLPLGFSSEGLALPGPMMAMLFLGFSSSLSDATSDLQSGIRERKSSFRSAQLDAEFTGGSNAMKRRV